MSNFRITTGGLYRNYRTNLYKNNKQLSDAMIGVETQRKFNTYAEDPAAASKAWRLRRSYWRTGDQIDNSNYVISKYESAYTAMGSIIDGDAGSGEYGLGLKAILSTIEGASDTSGASRNALGKELLQAADSIVSMMNSKYGDEFVFAGADGANIPFTWSEDHMQLLYRGVSVSAESPMSLAEMGLSKSLDDYGLKKVNNLYQVDMTEPLSEAGFTEALQKDAALRSTYHNIQTKAEYLAAYDQTVEGWEDSANAQYAELVKAEYANYQEHYMTVHRAAYDAYAALSSEQKEATATVPELTSFQEAQSVYAAVSYYNDYYSRNGVSYTEGAAGYAALERMANETTYMDVGLGMQEQDGELVAGSAFNSAISGLDFLGYGKDNNLVMLIHELGTIYSNADPETGDYANGATDEKRVNDLVGKLHNAIRYSQDQHTQLSADAKYLKTNLNQLETVQDELNQQIVDTEDLDMAEAITNMTWAQYCYNAALRIGNNILSQSLIDYMS